MFDYSVIDVYLELGVWNLEFLFMNMRWYQWTLIVIGVWLLAAPWLLGFSELNLAAWNSISAGSLVIVFTLWNYNPQR